MCVYVCVHECVYVYPCECVYMYVCVHVSVCDQYLTSSVNENEAIHFEGLLETMKIKVYKGAQCLFTVGKQKKKVIPIFMLNVIHNLYHPKNVNK